MVDIKDWSLTLNIKASTWPGLMKRPEVPQNTVRRFALAGQTASIQNLGFILDVTFMENGSHLRTLRLEVYPQVAIRHIQEPYRLLRKLTPKVTAVYPGSIASSK